MTDLQILPIILGTERQLSVITTGSYSISILIYYWWNRVLWLSCFETFEMQMFSYNIDANCLGTLRPINTKQLEQNWQTTNWQYFEMHNFKWKMLYLYFYLLKSVEMINGQIIKAVVNIRAQYHIVVLIKIIIRREFLYLKSYFLFC